MYLKTFGRYLYSINESNSKDTALDILKGRYEEDAAMDMVNDLSEIDKTPTKKMLPIMAYFYLHLGNDDPDFDETFADYFKVVNKMKPFQYTRKGVTYEGKVVTFKQFAQLVKDKIEHKESTDDSVPDLSDNKGLTLKWSNAQYKVYLADPNNAHAGAMEQCIYLSKGKPFCIGRANRSQNNYNSYRYRKTEFGGLHSTFYFIHDSSPLIPSEEIVVVEALNDGEHLMFDMDNRADGKYKTLKAYLDEHQEIKDAVKSGRLSFDSVEYNEKERDYHDKFKNKVNNTTFANFTYGEKKSYIEFLHDLSDEKWKTLKGDSNLRNLYINTGNALTDAQEADLTESEKGRYALIICQTIEQLNSDGRMNLFSTYFRNAERWLNNPENREYFLELSDEVKAKLPQKFKRILGL